MSQDQPSIKGDFNTAYIAANVSQDAAPYDSALFTGFKDQLESADPEYLSPFSHALLVQCSIRGNNL